MKVLVTGGAGFIGSHLVDRLLELKHEVVVVDVNRSVGYLFPFWNDKAENHKLEVFSFVDVRPLFENVSYVFHLASDLDIYESTKNSIKSNYINNFGTNVILQCAREAKVKRVIYMSTFSVYGNGKIPNVENQDLDFLNLYSLYKYQGEQLCKMYYKMHNLESIILRPYKVYGDRQPVRGKYSSTIHSFDTQKMKKQPLTIINGGTQREDFVHVSDVVEACILSMKAKLPKEHIASPFNIGSGVNYSIKEIAECYNYPTVNIKNKKIKQQDILADISKSQNFLSWNPKINLIDWLKETNA
jgi:UDP-glucose 4-epimerase